MYSHHQQSIENVTNFFQPNDEVQALVLGGSIAHGFASLASDVDVMIVVSDEIYAQRQARGELHFFNRELCTYPEGYVDGKYTCPQFLDQVRSKGSEPARFAFKDAKILFSRIDGLDETLHAIACYPSQEKIERIQRFYAQLEAWHWYTGEAIRTGNQYLLRLTTDKLILFGGRLILAHNELLYPYHKWFLRVLEQATYKPDGLLEQVDRLVNQPYKESIDQFYTMIKNFRTWESPSVVWPVQFQADSEFNWMNGPTPIDDL